MAFVSSLPVPKSRCHGQSVPINSRPILVRQKPRRLFPSSLRRSSWQRTQVPSGAFSPQNTTFSSGNGVSNCAETKEAVAEAVALAKGALPKSALPTLCVIAATADRDANEISSCFARELQGIPFMGATSCANVLTTRGPVQSGVSATILAADADSFVATSALFTDDVNPYEGAKKAAFELKAKATDEVKAVYMSATPGNEEEVLHGIQEILGYNVPVVGGSAADNDVTGKWAVFHDNKVIPNGVAMFAVVGSSVSAGASLISPYEPTERTFRVTEADGRTVISLEDKPAADVLYDIVGDPIAEEFSNGGMILGPMSTRPLSLRRTMANGTESYLAVHAASINLPDKSISLFAEANTGDVLTVMDNEGGGDTVRAAGLGIQNAFAKAKSNGNLRAPTCSFLVYCGGLSIAVGDRLAENLTQDYAEVAPQCAVGVTAFGEQGPLFSAPTAAPGNSHCNLSISMLLLE